MKKGIIVFAFIICFFVSFASCAELVNWQDKYVNDFGGVFSSEQISGLRSLLKGVEENTTAELVVVSVGECAPYAPSQYAHELFVKWGVGKSDKNNGLLALYCNAENKIWVEVGYGLEGMLPDSKIGALLDEYYVPLRDAGNVSEGIILFIEKSSEIIGKNREEVISEQENKQIVNDKNIQWIIVSALVVILLVFIFIRFLKNLALEKKKGYKDEVGNKKESYGIKQTKGVGALSRFLFIAAFFSFGWGNIILGIFLLIAAFFVSGTFNSVRCKHDGLKMKKIGKKDGYLLYKCPKGHIGGILAASAASGYFIGSGFGGGGGGFGGGGFGGGGGGGGGAGR